MFCDFRWLCLVLHECAKPIRAVRSASSKSSGRRSWKLGWTAQSRETHTSTSTSCIPPVPSSACTAGISSSLSSPLPPTGGSQPLRASTVTKPFLCSSQETRKEPPTMHIAHKNGKDGLKSLASFWLAGFQFPGVRVHWFLSLCYWEKLCLQVSRLLQWAFL